MLIKHVDLQLEVMWTSCLRDERFCWLQHWWYQFIYLKHLLHCHSFLKNFFNQFIEINVLICYTLRLELYLYMSNVCIINTVNYDKFMFFFIIYDSKKL